MPGDPKPGAVQPPPARKRDTIESRVRHECSFDHVLTVEGGTLRVVGTTAESFLRVVVEAADRVEATVLEVPMDSWDELVARVHESIVTRKR